MANAYDETDQMVDAESGRIVSSFGAFQSFKRIHIDIALPWG